MELFVMDSHWRWNMDWLIRVLNQTPVQWMETCRFIKDKEGTGKRENKENNSLGFLGSQRHHFGDNNVVQQLMWTGTFAVT